MNMGYISDTARNWTHNLFRPKREPIPLGHNDRRFWVQFLVPGHTSFIVHNSPMPAISTSPLTLYSFISRPHISFQIILNFYSLETLAVLIIIIITIYFKNIHFFHAQPGSDVFPDMRLLHISLNTTHSKCKPSSSISSFTHSLQVFLPLPAHLTPATTTFLQANTQSSPFLYSTCPNHLNLPRLTTSATLSTPKWLYKSTLRFLSFSDTLFYWVWMAGWRQIKRIVCFGRSQMEQESDEISMVSVEIKCD